MRRRAASLVLALVLSCCSALLLAADAADADDESMEPASAELRNLALGLPYTVSEEPNPIYLDEDYELTNGIYASLDYLDPEWVGHTRGMTRTVIFDLGEDKSISKITSNFLSGPPYGISVPLNVSYYVSRDGEKWTNLAHVQSKYYIWEDQGPRTQQYVWDGEVDGLPSRVPGATMAYARYVRVDFSVFQHMFIDEIEIWGYDGKTSKAIPLPPRQPQYLKPLAATGGIEHLVILPNGHYDRGRGDWTKEEIMPYISYIDSNGKPADWMFDGILFSPNYSPWGRRLGEGSPSSKLEDWQWYLEKTFASGGDVEQLNEAMQEAGEKLGNPGQQMKVVLTLPFPSRNQSDFGDVDGDGISENFNPEIVGAEQALENRKKTIAWYLDELFQRWEQAGYSHLQLVGIYWMAESMSVDYDLELVQFTRDLVHDRKLRLFWIPHFQAGGITKWREAGFDAVALQPNHYFDVSGEYRIQDAAQLAQNYGIGIEIETEESMNTSLEKRQKYTDYLNGGLKYGYMSNQVYKAYYQGNLALYMAATSDDPEQRINYDWMYQFIKGTYQPQDGGKTLDGSRNLVLGMGYTLSEPPHPDYPDSTGTELTDGVMGSWDMFHPTWQGHVDGSPTREVTFDLGEVKTITRVKASFFQSVSAAILYPDWMSVEISYDGEEWHELAEIPDTSEPDASSVTIFGWYGYKDGVPGAPDADMVQARYVRVSFPVERFVFIGEVEVFGFDEVKDGAVRLPFPPAP